MEIEQMSKKRNKKSKIGRKTRLIEGLPVVDAKHDLTININKHDIKHSRKGDPANCAAAVSCKRAFKTEVRVYLTKTYIKGKKNWVRYVTPEAISREIISFDRGSNFVPDTYKLKAPTSSQRLGENRPTGPKRESGKPARFHHITKEVRNYKEQSK